MDLSGAPKTKIAVSDGSALVQNKRFGKVCVQGPTLLGEVGKAVFIGNSFAFKRIFGGHHPDSIFPTLCMRMLDAGAQLYVSRLGHFTDIEDGETLEGTKATINITVTTDVLAVTAKHIGAGYNGIVIATSSPRSKAANKVDITVTVPGIGTEVVRDVPVTLNAAGLTEWSNKFQYIDLTSITGEIPVDGTGTLAGGVQTVANITAADRVGSKTSQRGWYAFSNIQDAFRVANIESQDPAVDIGLSAFCTGLLGGGNPMRFHVATPLAAVAAGMSDYRNGTGAYSHSPIDNWLGSLVAGAINILDPRDSSGNTKVLIPGVADVMPLQVKKDTDQALGPWWSAAGYKRGKITSPNYGVEYNLAAGNNYEDFDSIYANDGINAVINEDGQVMYWGNKSMLRDGTKLLSKENVADLVVFIMRNLRPLVKIEQFDPNDPLMWKKMYTNVYPFITDVLVRGRAIRPGENKMWFWIGDQDVDNYEDAQFNLKTELDQGIYKARFVFVPVPATEFIGIDVSVSDSQALSFAVSENV